MDSTLIRILSFPNEALDDQIFNILIRIRVVPIGASKYALEGAKPGWPAIPRFWSIDMMNSHLVLILFCLGCTTPFVCVPFAKCWWKNLLRLMGPVDQTDGDTTINRFLTLLKLHLNHCFTTLSTTIHTRLLDRKTQTLSVYDTFSANIWKYIAEVTSIEADEIWTTTDLISHAADTYPVRTKLRSSNRRVFHGLHHYALADVLADPRQTASATANYAFCGSMKFTLSVRNPVGIFPVESWVCTLKQRGRCT